MIPYIPHKRGNCKKNKKEIRDFCRVRWRCVAAQTDQSRGGLTHACKQLQELAPWMPPWCHHKVSRKLLLYAWGGDLSVLIRSF
jgi:hypothetical protein